MRGIARGAQSVPGCAKTINCSCSGPHFPLHPFLPLLISPPMRFPLSFLLSFCAHTLSFAACLSHSLYFRMGTNPGRRLYLQGIFCRYS